MNQWLKSERGSMAVYVFVTIFTFLIILGGIFGMAATIRESQLKTELKIKESYQRDNNKVEEIYNEQITKLESAQK